MSYAPGHDGPPVSTLDVLPDDGRCTCGGSNMLRDWYYAERWLDDDASAQYIYSCLNCSTSWRAPEEADGVDR